MGYGKHLCSTESIGLPNSFVSCMLYYSIEKCLAAAEMKQKFAGGDNGRGSRDISVFRLKQVACGKCSSSHLALSRDLKCLLGSSHLGAMR